MEFSFSKFIPLSSKFVPLSAPYEDETKTYIKSFDLSSPVEIRSFFLKYGFVVISNILTEDDRLKSVSEVYADLKYNSFDKFDPTLENYDVLDKFVKRFGLIGGGWPVLLPQSIKNRQNENVYQAYKYATNNLYFISAFERYGFMVPNKKFPQIQTLTDWLHIDYNPLSGKTSVFGYNETLLHSNATPENPIPWQNAYFQGIISLEDCPEEVGGFHCVPGFHNYLEEWKNYNKEACLNSHLSHDYTTVQIPYEDEIRNFIQKIPIRKGCLLIWDGRLAHGNFPNSSDKPRLVQYVKYNAVGKDILSNVYSQVDRWNDEERDMLKKVDVTDLGKKLFGLKKWYEEQVLGKS